MDIEEGKDYYINQKARLMKDLNNSINSLRKLLARKLEAAKVDKIMKQINKEFEELIPKIPYIGGDKKWATETLIGFMSNLAVFWTLEKEGFTYREIGEIYYNWIDSEFRLEKENMENNGKDPAQFLFEKDYIAQVKINCEQTQNNTYTYRVASDFVEGDDLTFEYGIDISECGPCKLFTDLGAEKYLPLLCMNVMHHSSIFGYGLFRTQTIMMGAPTCNYRYVRKLKAPQTITEEEVTYLKEKRICLVCKGKIQGFNNYICPKCEVLYCENCARALIDLENSCWVCKSPFDMSKPSKSFKGR